MKSRPTNDPERERRNQFAPFVLATAWLFAFFYPSDFAKLSCNNSTLDDSSSCLEVTVSHACKVHIFEVFSDARSVFGYILLEKVTRFKVSPLVGYTFS